MLLIAGFLHVLDGPCPVASDAIAVEFVGQQDTITAELVSDTITAELGNAVIMAEISQNIVEVSLDRAVITVERECD